MPEILTIPKMAIFKAGVPGTLKLTAKTTENGWLEYYFPIGMAYFQGRSVSFREGNLFQTINFLGGVIHSCVFFGGGKPLEQRSKPFEGVPIGFS